MASQRPTTIRARVSHEEHAEIMRRAADRDLSLSEYIRQSALGRIEVVDVIEIPPEPQPRPWYRRLWRAPQIRRP